MLCAEVCFVKAIEGLALGGILSDIHGYVFVIYINETDPVTAFFSKVD